MGPSGLLGPWLLGPWWPLRPVWPGDCRHLFCWPWDYVVTGTPVVTRAPVVTGAPWSLGACSDWGPRVLRDYWLHPSHAVVNGSSGHLKSCRHWAPVAIGATVRPEWESIVSEVIMAWLWIGDWAPTRTGHMTSSLGPSVWHSTKHLL